jgi:hypothetical protein
MLNFKINTMEYIVDGSHFIFSYQEVKDKCYEFSNMKDEDFVNNLPAATHLACVVCYFKEVPTYLCLSDKGIIHELIHLMHIPEGNTTTLKEIRKLFDFWIKLD